MPLELVANTPTIRLYQGNSSLYPWRDVDLILTNLYAPLPEQFRVLPMLVTDFAERKVLAEDRAGCTLTEIARYGMNQRTAVWAGNLEPKPVDLSCIGDEMFAPDRGWWPLDLPVRLLEAYAWCDGLRVWDGFCGRGTTGKGCRLLGHSFVGIDRDPARVEIARRYLGV